MALLLMSSGIPPTRLLLRSYAVKSNGHARAIFLSAQPLLLEDELDERISARMERTVTAVREGEFGATTI
ncbi:hypothetical protein ACWC9T_30435 [Kitasatospora sp. NPDC001159]